MEEHVEPKVGDPRQEPDEVSSAPTLDEEKRERVLIWKIDLHVLPVVVFLYLFSFLDRGAWVRSPLSMDTELTLYPGSEYRQCSVVWVRRGPWPGRGPVPGGRVYPLCDILCMSNAMGSLLGLADPH